MDAHSPLRLPVRTAAGQKLGHVVDVTIDPQTQSIVAYHVKPSRLVPDMVQSPLLIHHSQVISITEQEIVVDDALSKQRGTAPAPLPTA